MAVEEVTKNKIIVVGDVHGEFGVFNSLMSKYQPEIVLQCGDFGYWPKMKGKTYLDGRGRIKKWETEVKNHNTKVYWAPGNHEDWDSIDQITNYEIFPNVFYMKKGSTLELPDGRMVMFIGGGLSIDKAYRTPGIDWFPQEAITQKDIYDLPDIHVDIMITHAAPQEFKLFDLLTLKTEDPARKALSYVLEKYRPKKWFFGHYHQFDRGTFCGTEWTALGHTKGGMQWWVEL